MRPVAREAGRPHGGRLAATLLALLVASGCATGRARPAAPCSAALIAPTTASSPRGDRPEGRIVAAEAGPLTVPPPGVQAHPAEQVAHPPPEGPVATLPEETGPRDHEPSAKALVLRTKSIYGDDDRRDLRAGTTTDLAPRAPKDSVRVGTRKEWAERVLAAGRAVALMVLATELTARTDGALELASVSYAKHVLDTQGYPLCLNPPKPFEPAPFKDQPTAGLCTAWLAAPTLVVTARHCVAGRAATELAFVFGWQQRADGTFPGTPARLEAAQVYRGRAFRSRGTGGEDGDYAVIELDRPVPPEAGITPLTLRRTGRPQIDDPLYLLGCPRGLPVKFAGGAVVKAVHRGLPLLRADLDAFQGNSGSPVLSSLDHRVVGILVRGKSDFFLIRDPLCVVEARLNTHRDGETVLGSVAFARHIPLPANQAP